MSFLFLNCGHYDWPARSWAFENFCFEFQTSTTNKRHHDEWMHDDFEPNAKTKQE